MGRRHIAAGGGAGMLPNDAALADLLGGLGIVPQSLVVVAPATAGLIAKAANGLADDLASTTLIATDKRVLLAPAMNVRMWLHPATVRNRASLAAISGEIRIAESDLETRQTLLAGAAEQMESARLEANKQVRYLSMSLPPVAADTPTYPKAFQNTIVAFLIFAALYLMLSLTASILREQVST